MMILARLPFGLTEGRSDILEGGERLSKGFCETNQEGGAIHVKSSRDEEHRTV